MKTRSSDGPPAARARQGVDGRASPEAVEKRRAARLFNEALLGRGPHGGALDGRTERRRKRLLRELGAAAAGKLDLKPIDVLARVQALLAIGEPVESLRKAYPPRRPVEVTDVVVEGVRRIHQAYGFPTEAYRFVGLEDAVLRRAGLLGRKGEKRAPGPGPSRARAPARRPGLAVTGSRASAPARGGVG